jgi:hypothetical protein
MKGILQLVLWFFMGYFVQAQKDCRYDDYQQKIIDKNASKKNTSIPTRHQPIIKLNLVRTDDSLKDANSRLLVIPVVIHILYNNTSQNISDAQVLSQIAALNSDFRGSNSERSKIPAYFTDLAADCEIEFKLASVDPQGYMTNGIVRKFTNIKNFGMNDRVKSSALGGDDIWDSNKYLNIWVCNLAGGILGYSSSPGGPADKDGVVISPTCFGTIGTLSYPFNFGRTATHEIGHWLNLKHTWGDSYCGDDQVYDTPKQRNANRGCPSGKQFSCESSGNGDMYMNFMDLTDDGCMFMFTKGQKERMHDIFKKGGSRYLLLSSNVLDPQAGKLPLDIVVSSASTLRLYPNPATKMLTVYTGEEHHSMAGSKKLVIYNHVGQVVISQLVQSSKVTVNVSHLEKGLYILSLTEGNKKKVVKFTKF